MREVVAALLFCLQAATRPAGSVISGRVTEAGTGRPLPRILVSLASPDRAKRNDTITDAEGRYAFTGVAPGRYAVSAEPGEHQSTYVRQWFGEPAPTTPWSPPPRFPIDIAAAAASTTADIALTPALAIEGRVMAPWEEPIANVEIFATYADGRTVITRPAYSDDLGNYRVYGLAPGRYRLCARMADSGGDDETSRQSPLVPTCHPAAIAERDAADVTLTSRDVAGIDIRIQRTAGRAVSGSVTDASGAPADGGLVAAFAMDGSMRSATAGVRAGVFTIRGLVPGRYAVFGSIGVQSPADPNPPSREGEIGYAAVDVTAVDASGVTIALSKGATVPGRVVFEGARPPAARGRAMIIGTGTVFSHPWFLDRPPFGVVAGDLTFTLTNVYRWPLVVRPDHLPDGWALKAVRLQDRDITNVATDLWAATAPIEVVFTNRVARPRIRVTDTRGAAVTDYRLVVLPTEPSQWYAGMMRIEAEPDANGTLEPGALLPGEYLMAALTFADLTLLFEDRSRLDSLARVATKVTLGEGDSGTIDLRVVRLPDKQ